MLGQQRYTSIPLSDAYVRVYRAHRNILVVLPGDRRVQSTLYTVDVRLTRVRGHPIGHFVFQDPLVFGIFGLLFTHHPRTRATSRVRFE
jgi:hypothetical protein